MRSYKAPDQSVPITGGRTTKNMMLLALLGFCLPIALSAQYVQVPMGSGSIVVVAGTGGNTGLNRVGHGGVVRMIDGFDSPGAGGNFSFAGPTVHAWTLAGDLSMQVDYAQVAPVPGANPSVQNAGPVTTVNIQSYNKNLRAIELSAASKGRSKGRVSVLYKAAPCDSTLVFDVFKEWTSGPPPVSFPNCWPSILQTVSLSVDPLISDNAADLIGFDQYYWKLINGGGVDLFAALNSAYTFSADRSSILLYMGDPAFQSWYTGGPYTVQCCYGRANAWDGGAGPLLGRLLAGTTCASQVIGMPVAPAYTGGFPTCVNAVSPSMPITINSSNYNSAYTYNWSRSNLTWLFTPNGSGGLTINSIGDGNPCTFILNCAPVIPNVGCAATFTYTINRNYNNAAILAAPSPYCASTGTFTVNLGSAYSGNQTCWSGLPGGWTAVNPMGVPSAVQFTIPAAAAGTTANINLFSCACPSVLLPIVINARPGTPVITGPQCVAINGVVNQTWNATSAGAGVNNFNWNNTMGMTPVGPNFTDAAGVFAPAGAAEGNVSVYTQNVAGCPSATTTYNVGRNAVAPVVLQPPCYTLGYTCPHVPGLAGTASFTIDAVNFALNGSGTYTWTFPANGFFNTTASPVVVTQGTNATVVRPTTGVPSNSVPAPPLSYYQFTVCFTPAIVPPNLVACANACTTVTAAPVNLGVVTYTPIGATGYLAPPSAPATTTYFAYDCAIPGSYGSSVTYPTAATLPTVIAANSGLLTLQMTVPGGCIWRPDPVVTSHKSMLVVDDNGSELTPAQQTELGITVSPNPNSGRFQVFVTRDFEQASTTLFDAQGRRVARPTRLVPGPNSLDFGDLKPGVYILRTEFDGETDTQSVVITKD